MKKVVFALLAIVAFSQGAAAQTQIYIEPKAGPTFTTIRFGQNDNVHSRTGYMAGAGVNISLDSDRFFSIQPEILYFQKGARLTQVPVYNNVEYILNYLEVPVLGRLSFGGRTLRAFVNAGPYAAYALDGRNKAGDNDFDITFARTGEADFNNRFDYGLQFGGGAGFRVGLGEITLGVRYGLGLANLYSRQVADVPQSQNRTIAVMLNYAVLIGGN
jgi:hypothetical protein